MGWGLKPLPEDAPLDRRIARLQIIALKQMASSPAQKETIAEYKRLIALRDAAKKNGGWLKVSAVRIKNGQLQLRNPSTYYNGVRADKATLFQELFGKKTIRYKGDLARSRKATRKVAAVKEYKLQVDITGNGRWVDQAEGSKGELGKMATKIRAREGMKTRLVPL